MAKPRERTSEELKEEIEVLKPLLKEAILESKAAYVVYYSKATKMQRLSEKFKELDLQLAEAEKRVTYLKPGQSGIKRKGGEPKDPKEHLEKLLKGMSRSKKEEFIRELLANK